MRRRIVAVAALLCLAAASPPLGAKAPIEWDGLVRVKAKRLDAVFLMPNADFRGYSKIIIDRPQIAFRKDWQRDFNRSTAQRRVTDQEVRQAIDGASGRFEGILEKAYVKAGYQIVDQPGLDVLRVSTAVINVSVNAPERVMPGRTRVYASEAGEGQLVLEARDSVSGALLGRALDHRIAGDDMAYLADAVSNRADFERMFASWARLSAAGLDKLKSLSPIDVNGIQRK